MKPDWRVDYDQWLLSGPGGPNEPDQPTEEDWREYHEYWDFMDSLREPMPLEEPPW